MNEEKLEHYQKWCQENLLNRTEAMAITKQSSYAFTQSVYTKQLLPFVEKKGNTPSGTVRLFLKQDVEAYAKKIQNRQKSHHIDCDGFFISILIQGLVVQIPYML
ncbi:hypothetical protein EB41_02920 [Enterococcus faecalis]|uniref:hypothetical protein n=1 Tax=Enterococcus faecalis TaxID=1351 RepID=UPI000E066ED6|nr:hypothetical protein [Enterococcus faecalis]RBR61835.1 hypothetical protein EB41_02920 [Enterococcus faecalis]